MTRFEELKNMNIDALAEWLDKYGRYGDAPWDKWFDESYCQKCESVRVFVPYLNGEHECGYCEANNKCRYFMEMDELPDSKDVVKMWLESEVE